MSDLGGAIDLVVQRISKHGAASFNEENTAVVLIVRAGGTRVGSLGPRQMGAE
ncbi:MAG TPA: hypothetical protein VIK38_12070 [Coriobacteriia bacterium]